MTTIGTKGSVASKEGASARTASASANRPASFPTSAVDPAGEPPRKRGRGRPPAVTSGLPVDIRERILAAAENGRIDPDRMMEISNLTFESDPAEIAALESILEDAGVTVTDISSDALLDEGAETTTHTELDPLQIYIMEISRTPLLIGADEIRLGREIAESLAEIRLLVEESGLQPAELRRYCPAPGDAPPPPLKGHDRRTLAKQAKRLFAAEARFAEAQRTLIEANLRLVVSIAKRYVYHGLHLLDLINEGNLGLIRAVERFDYKRGFKFSTYASWWIRQSIRRAIADQGRIIRVPVHMSDSISRWIKATRALSQKLGREPTIAESAKEMGISEPKLLEIMKVSQEPSSLEAPILSSQDSSLAELVEDAYAVSPYKTVLSLAFSEHLQKMLAVLQEKERRIVELRFGLYGQNEHTLEEVGNLLGITRERVRQLEMRALKKLRHLRLAEELYSMMAEIGR
jgi:RNA polymerase primary sigma factor